MDDSFSYKPPLRRRPDTDVGNFPCRRYGPVDACMLIQ